VQPSLMASIRWQDALDICLIAFLVYRAILLVRGTRAASMLIGLVVVVAVYMLARSLKLHTISWIFDQFLSSIIIVAVVIFQHDIRRMLVSMGRGTFFRSRGQVQRTQMIEELVRGLVSLVSNKRGGIVVLQRKVGLTEYVEAGTAIDGVVSRELLSSIFVADSPVHDGAVIIAGNRIEAAGCLLPLTTNPNVSRTLGTRHRAALGLTEETDAIALVVSEEDQSISLVVEGHITRAVDSATLRKSLAEMLQT